jgi:uncharacterized repeat protein (TIGR02543 family)
MANGQNLSNADSVLLYVDGTKLKNTDTFSVGFRLYLSQEARSGWFVAGETVTLKLKDGETAWYYPTDLCEWRSAVVSDDKIEVGNNFCGYILFSLSSFKHVEETDMLYLSGKSTFSDLLGAGYQYQNRIRLFFGVADEWESQTPIYIDDLCFVQTGSEHTHSFVKTGAVVASCTNEGYDIYSCSCGENVKQNIQEKTAHRYGESKIKDGVAYHICADCDRVETVGSATVAGQDELVCITFDYGEAGGTQAVYFVKGSVIGYEDIPFKMTYFDRYTYQFNGWTSDEDNIEPEDPIGQTATEDKTFYARYLIASYADKYVGAVSILSFNGGVYQRDIGKIVIYGNSNMSLFHTVESEWGQEGLPTYNNSVAGSTSYDMINFYKALVLSYKPKIIVTNLTTNDMKYYFMSDKQILANMNTLYEMTQKYLPDTQIFCSSGNPLPGRTEFTQSIIRVNAQMNNYCNDREKITYCDVYRYIIDYADIYPVGWEFWTHLDQEGLRGMFNLIKADVQAYVATNNIRF